MRHDSGQLVAAPSQIVHCDSVLAMRGSVRTEYGKFLVMQLIDVQRADGIVLGQSREVHHPSSLRRHQQGGLLG